MDNTASTPQSLRRSRCRVATGLAAFAVALAIVAPIAASPTAHHRYGYIGETEKNLQPSRIL